MGDFFFAEKMREKLLCNVVFLLLRNDYVSQASRVPQTLFTADSLSFHGQNPTQLEINGFCS